MQSFMAKHMIRHYLPDDRLATVRLYDDGLILFAYRFGHIHPALVQSLDRLSTGISHSGMLLYDPEHPSPKPEIMAWFEAGNLGEPLHPRVGDGDGFGLPPFWEVRIRADFIDPALIREVNELALPAACAALHPFGAALPM